MVAAIRNRRYAQFRCYLFSRSERCWPCRSTEAVPSRKEFAWDRTSLDSLAYSSAFS
jgi:hypothetical protein